MRWNPGIFHFMQGVIEQYQQETEAPFEQIAAALATMALGDRPLLMKPGSHRPPEHIAASAARDSFHSRADERGENRRSDKRPEKRPRKPKAPAPEEMERFRLEVGHEHGVEPGNIVGAIANEAGIDSSNIGHIEIFADHSVVELPIGMPREIFSDLRKAWVCGKQLNLSRLDKPGAGSKSDTAPRVSALRTKPRKRDNADNAAGSPRPEKSADAPRVKKTHRKGGPRPPEMRSDQSPGHKSDQKSAKAQKKTHKHKTKPRKKAGSKRKVSSD